MALFKKAFRKTPAGMARKAREDGHKIFQYIDVVSKSDAEAVAMTGAFTRDEEGSTDGKRGRVVASPIEQIESEGWRLEDVGYVFQETGSQSRDKFWKSGQDTAVSGRILGIYLFRLKA